MPRLIDTESRTGTVVAAINDILAREGVGGLSLRSIARTSGVSTSSLLHHFDSREHLIRVGASVTGRARARRIDLRTRSEGSGAFLPRDGEELLDERAWLAWLELWRSERSLSEVIATARLDERALLAETLDYAVAADGLGALLAVLDGLRAGLCAPVGPLPLDVSREVLGRFVAALHVDGAAHPDPYDVIRNRMRRWRERAAP
jgi:AcrR family transcriptional regulator